MQIEIRNKRCKTEKILETFPDAIIIDVTSKAEGEWKKLSPFYPHGDIPIPFTDGITSYSVEGVWQGLKVFENEGVDFNSFRNKTTKNIKRTVRKHGRCLGHNRGVKGKDLLTYIESRKEIYVPTYKWILENKCQEQIKKLKEHAEEHVLVLLDYDTNEDINDPTKPLSHASLIKRYLLAGV